MRIFRIIPFSWLPSSWGLSGQLRQEQEAAYYYEGHDLDVMIAHIYYSGDALTHRLLEIDHQHGVLNDQQYEIAKANLITDPVEREVSLIEVKLKNGEITQNDADKEIATLRGKPWIRIVRDGQSEDEEVPNGYYFEFDWNDLWIDKLQEAGYSGKTQEDIVNLWFQVLCNSGTNVDDITINDPWVR